MQSNKSKFGVARVWQIALFFAIFFSVPSGWAAPLLFSAAPAPLTRQAADEVTLPGYKRTRQAQINPEMLLQTSPLRRQGVAIAGDEPSFTLNLFGDRELNVLITKTVSKGVSTFITYGKVEGVPQSQVILSVANGIISGSVFVPGHDTVQIFYSGNGFHTIAEIDPAQVPPCGADNAPVKGILPVAGDLPATAGTALTSVDVMVVYTSAARIGAGGTDAMQTLIDLAIAEANEAYANSQVNVELHLVYRGEISYGESGNAVTDLNRLQNPSDGQLDTVAGLRSTYGADTVVLITENMATYAGLSFVMSPVSSAFSDFAFSVVKRQYASGSYVFAHEVSHVMGCQHDRENSSSAGAYDYSYGYRFDAAGDTYRTVMAYAPGTRIPYFSNPNVNFLSVATGIASGATNSADNASSLNNTAATVAAFEGEAAMLNFEITSTNLTEGAATYTFNVIRSGLTNTAATVNYGTLGITATTGSDFTAANGTLSFDAGETSKSISITILNDATLENDETFKVVLSSATGAVIGPDGTLVITIQDDDVGFKFSSATSSVDEGGTNAVITVMRTGDSSGTNTVDYATSDLTATGGSDYTATNGTLTFNAGVTNLTITVPITDDSAFENNETFQVGLINPGSGAALVTPANLVVTILENDSALSLSTNAISFSETSSNAVVTVVRSGGTNTSATVDYFTSDGTATNAVDYTATNGTLTFAAGVVSQTISVPLINDSNVDGDNNFTLTLTNATGAVLGSTTASTVTIKDNDSTFQFSTNAVTVAETTTSLTLNVVRSGGVVGAATVKYATSNDTATAGSDYKLASGTLSFAAGETNKTITLSILNDTTNETDEAFNVVLSSPTGEATLGTNSSVAVTITDNDSLLAFATNAVSVSEGAGTVTLTINRTGTLTLTNTLAYTVKAGTATSADYTATNGVLTFLPNATNATITIGITDDNLVEASETFSVTLGTAGGGAKVSGTNTAVVTITDNDVGLAFSSATYSVDEGATNVVLTVVQTGATNSTASVDYASSDLSATAGSDYTATNGTLNFGPGTNSLTISIPIINDSEIESNETFRVTLSNPGNGAILLANSAATVKILEDDSALAFSTNAVSVLESATSISLTILRTGGTNYTSTADYLTADGTATDGADYTSTNGTITFNPGENKKTVTVLLSNDSIVEGNEAFTMTLTNVTGAIFGTYTNSTVTILDNDSTFNFLTNVVSLSESAGNTVISVRRTGGVAAAATIHYSTTNGTATAGVDYRAATGTLKFAAGETNKTITIGIINDAVVDPNETFTVGLSLPTGEGSVGTNNVVTLTIIDNDFSVGDVVKEIGIQNILITGIAFDGAGEATIEVQGPYGAAVILESSEDLTNWQPVSEGVLSADPFESKDAITSEQTRKFYRVAQPAETDSTDTTP